MYKDSFISSALLAGNRTIDYFQIARRKKIVIIVQIIDQIIIIFQAYFVI